MSFNDWGQLGHIMARKRATCNLGHGAGIRPGPTGKASLCCSWTSWQKLGHPIIMFACFTAVPVILFGDQLQVPRYFRLINRCRPSLMSPGGGLQSKAFGADRDSGPRDQQIFGDHVLYCANCGHQRIEDASYCQNCGRVLDPSGGLSRAGSADLGVKPGAVPWRGGHVALGIVVVAVFVIPMTAIAIGLGRLAGQYDEAMTTWLGVHLLGLAIIGVVWRFGIRGINAPLSTLGLTPIVGPRFKTVLMTAGALGASLAATVVYGVLISLIDSDILSPPDISPDIGFPGLAAVFTFQALAVATPVVEEVFFRGFVFSGLVPRLGVGWAMVASAVVFSVFHLAVGVFIPIFVTGLLLAWLYQRTGSLWPCIVAHAGQNALALALEVYWV
jgi:membrane protease YdiL (CAAX protease family)